MCTVRGAQVLLTVTSIVVLCLGLALLVTGALYSSVYSLALGPQLDVVAARGADILLLYAPYIIAGLGGFIVIVGVIGIVGAVRKNHIVLGIFIFLVSLMVLVFLGCVAVYVLLAVWLNLTTQGLAANLKRETYAHGTNGFPMYTKHGQEMETLQTNMNCCGIYGPGDYNATAMQVLFHEKAPISCCSNLVSWGDPAPQCQYFQHQSGEYVGCADTLHMLSLIVGATVVAIACLFIFSLMFGVCLCCIAKREHKQLVD